MLGRTTTSLSPAFGGMTHEVMGLDMPSRLPPGSGIGSMSMMIGGPLKTDPKEFPALGFGEMRNLVTSTSSASTGFRNPTSLDTEEFPSLSSSQVKGNNGAVCVSIYFDRFLICHLTKYPFYDSRETFFRFTFFYSFLIGHRSSFSSSSSSLSTVPLPSSSQTLSKEAIQDRHETKSMVTGDISEGNSRSANDLGLAGYLDIVHSQDSDLLDVALGTDLTSFGFPTEAIESSSTLYPTFLSPWSDVSAKKEAEHLIAPCYYISPPFPAPSDRMSKFSDETLFYIFYAMPRDFMQEWAVQVLYDRGWRFHKDTKVWLTIDSEAPPTVRTPTYERGMFVYFDISSWEKIKKEFIITPDQLDERPKTRS